jgi:fibronectin-binding autotransporter adhesin
MKARNILASLLIAAGVISAPVFAQSNPAAAGIGGASIGNTIKGTATLNGSGSAESSALNTQTSQATLNAVTGTNVNAATAAFTGTTVQTGQNQSWNYSTGGGSGSASSTGTNTAGVVGVANIGQIGVGAFPPIGLTGTLTGAGGAVVTIGDNTEVGTNQGQASATQGNGTIGVSIGATTGGAIVTGDNDNANTSNQITLTGTSTGNVSVSAATGNVNLQTGLGPVQGDGSQAPVITTLGGGVNTPTGSAGFAAGVNGNGAVIDTAGTNASLGAAIVPGTQQLVTLAQ